MQRNFVAEGEVRQACADAGVLESAIEDFIAEFQAGVFDRNGIAEHIAQAKTNKPHRWASEDDSELFIRAFAQGNLSAQGLVVRKLGETAAQKIAEQFGTSLGATKPGIVPENYRNKIPDHDHARPSTNPWSAHPSNLDHLGRYSARAITSQANVVKNLGEQKAAAIAAAAGGAKLGDIRPPARGRAANL